MTRIAERLDPDPAARPSWEELSKRQERVYQANRIGDTDNRAGSSYPGQALPAFGR